MLKYSRKAIVEANCIPGSAINMFYAELSQLTSTLYHHLGKHWASERVMGDRMCKSRGRIPIKCHDLGTEHQRAPISLNIK